MNLLERRGTGDPLDALLRQSLDEQTCGKVPSPQVREELLRRAAGQQRRPGARASLSFWGHAGKRESPLAAAAPQHHFMYLEALFGPRVILFSFNQFMR